MNYYQESLKAHKKWAGKISTELKCELENQEDLSIAYTPGVAQPCKDIHVDKELAYDYTWKSNTIAIVSDGSAVLGLGNIGPEAAMPVMEGKAVLFKRFGEVNAVPLCIDTQDTNAIITFVKQIAPTFGGINLEDIAAPKCVEIERKLIEELNIPVFHDDQHGTAIVVTAALINSLKLVGKKREEITVVVTGAGAAGSSIIRMLNEWGVSNIYAFSSQGIITKQNVGNNFVKKEISLMTNANDEILTLKEALSKADVYIGVSSPGIVTEDMVKGMKKDSIVFPMANPEPEISYDSAIKAGARIVGTGRSDFPNQVNNVLAFPGVFKGALKVRASKITEEMKFAAAEGLASLVSDDELSDTFVIPKPFNPRVSDVVAKAVAKKAIEQGLAKLPYIEEE